jgi:mycobactin lysine-N-oxygenase
MPTQRLAVIGAGPKGAALATKAWCLRLEGFDVQVELFERYQTGAHWSGKHGYTDGEQRLCTPAERDLGFPYNHDLGRNVAEVMEQRFSWQAFLVAAEDGGHYADWVNHGRKPPLHSEFTRYLDFAFKRAETEPVIGTVQKVEIEDNRWTVVSGRGLHAKTYDKFDGLVVTGPGPAKSKVSKVKDSRLFDGVDFWSRKGDRDAAIAGLNGRGVVIVGGGGTAAAVTAWFLRNNQKAPISLINSQAMLFTRTTNFFESSIFNDEVTWQAIDPNSRRSFTARLNRGVVWETITDLLSDADNLTLLPGRASEICLGDPAADGSAGPLVVTYANYGAKGLSQEAGLVVDATGFDEWDFLKLLPANVKTQLADDSRQKGVMEKMDRDLSLPLVGTPKLHAPNLSEMIGPGYQSLMVLGAMADRVLKPYRDASG